MIYGQNQGVIDYTASIATIAEPPTCHERPVRACRGNAARAGENAKM
jgi:hypothetical protein